jgi:hypothetical protein
MTYVMSALFSDRDCVVQDDKSYACRFFRKVVVKC